MCVCVCVFVSLLTFELCFFLMRAASFKAPNHLRCSPLCTTGLLFDSPSWLQCPWPSGRFGEAYEELPMNLKPKVQELLGPRPRTEGRPTVRPQVRFRGKHEGDSDGKDLEDRVWLLPWQGEGSNFRHSTLSYRSSVMIHSI